MTEQPMTPMTTDPTAPVGSEANPLIFDVMSRPAPDAVAAAVVSMGDAVVRYAADFRSAADLSANLPADLRQIVSEAASDITSTVATVDNARVKADSFRADKTLYPEGRDLLAGEVLTAAADRVTESFASADVRLQVAEASLYEAARPLLARDDAMPARADLQMMVQRHISNPVGLADTLKRLAQRSDGVGALVADQSYLNDFLDAQGVEPDLRNAVLSLVSAEVVKAAVDSGDPKRAAAGRTRLALTELRKARAAATSYTQHKLTGK